MTLVRRVLPDALAAAAIALAILAFFGGAFLNYDSFYALVWGDDLVNGRTPDYEVPVAPTPHPLAIAVGAALSPLGETAAEDVFLGLILLAFGALCVALFRLGAELYAWPVGLLCAAIFLTRVPPLNFGVRGYVDLATIALIVWAALLEARKPRRGVAVLVLLALAGLLRPEAWLFAGLYWLWLVLPFPRGRLSRLAFRTLGRARAPRRALGQRLGLLLLAAAAPLAWMLSDLLVTGDPFWSLNGTSDLAAALDRPTGLDDLPRVLPRRLGEIMRLPELLAAVGGAAAGLAWLRRRTALPLAVAIGNGLAFLVFAVAGLSLLGRYLFLAASMLSLLAAVGALGWLALPAGHPARTPWRAGGVVVVVVLGVFFALQQVDRLSDLRSDIRARDRVQADLHDLVEGRRAAALIERCDRVFVPNHRPVPLLAYWTDRRPSEVVSATRRRPGPDSTFIAPRPEVAHLSILDKKDPTLPAESVPVGYRLAAENRSWRMFAGPACGL